MKIHMGSSGENASRGVMRNTSHKIMKGLHMNGWLEFLKMSVLKIFPNTGAWFQRLGA